MRLLRLVVIVGHGQICTPPAAAHCDEQLDCVLVTLRFSSDITKPRLLVLTLRIQQGKNSGTTVRVVDTLQAHGLRRQIERVLLCRQQIRIVSKRLQDISNLTERLQHCLPVISRRGLELS
jgi:hypothetical protein